MSPVVSCRGASPICQHMTENLGGRQRIAEAQRRRCCSPPRPFLAGPTFIFIKERYRRKPFNPLSRARKRCSIAHGNYRWPLTFKRNVVWQSNGSSVGRRVWPMFFGPSAVTFDFESMQIFLQ